MGTNRFYITLMIVLLLILGYLSYLIFRPFLIPIAWAIVLSILFYPFYTVILRYIRWKPAASFFVLIVILLIIIGPISYLSFLLVRELGALTGYADAERIEAIKNITRHPIIKTLVERITSLLNVTEEELHMTVSENMTQLGRQLLSGIRRGISEIITGLLNFIFMAISIFFLLKDGPGFLKRVLEYMPFHDEQKNRLVNKIKDIVISTMYGGVVVGLAQGTVGGFAFALLGISSPVIWGFAMAIASFLPLIGPFIIWMPASVYLVIKGEILKGIILAVIGAFGISLIDNLLRPIIIGTRTKMPFILLFFSVLGGIKLFGLIGFIMGPMIMAVLALVVEIFRSIDAGAVNSASQ
ncbi:MAG: AI-2E family transporter [Nitrospirae bacterium]|jgi:predicted PurR-regulated permease PerM|nr:AI-2E family transporter [Nitrospirota bacterium]